VETYEPMATATEPIMAYVSFYRGKVKSLETEPLLLKDGLDSKTKALPVRFSVPLSKLAPGQYTCQVTLYSPGQQKFSFTRSEIYLVP